MSFTLRKSLIMISRKKIYQINVSKCLIYLFQYFVWILKENLSRGSKTFFNYSETLSIYFNIAERYLGITFS